MVPFGMRLEFCLASLKSFHAPVMGVLLDQMLDLG
jgi:hypothetical protein